jgi:hypothetical protein
MDAFKKMKDEESKKSTEKTCSFKPHHYDSKANRTPDTASSTSNQQKNFYSFSPTLLEIEQKKIAKLQSIPHRKPCKAFSIGKCQYEDRCWDSHGKKPS